MKDELCIAIVAAGSALLGTLIPTVISYLSNLKQNKFELEKTLLEKQKDIYWDLMVSLQNMINSPTNEAFNEMQKSVIKLSIYGDNKSSISLNNYYRELINSSNGARGPLTQAEHQQFQKEIVNGMRSNLGLEPFENFEIVGFRPTN